ncbi:MAG: hypothetical protein H6855_04520 [Rhodospirillales bacterium]|nr:hypothetical protein [Rhodospirillales bacterium]
MIVALPLALTIFVWSLYPLLSVWVLEEVNSFTMMLLVQFFAFHGALFFALVSLIKNKQLKSYLQLQVKLGNDGWILVLVAGACSAATHIFFIFALQMANKNGISLVYDVWPLFALFFAPHMIDKQWNKTNPKDYLIGLVALGGVAMIVLSDENINWFHNETLSFETIMAYGMVLLASYLAAVLNLTRTQYSRKLEQAGLENSFAAVFISEMFARFVAVGFILLCIFGVGLEINTPTAQDVGILFIIGAGIFTIGGAAFTFALLKAKNANISLFFYMVPVFAVCWLVAFGESILTPTMLTGGVITLSACAYLMYRNKKSS